jgi:hypothetical protein
MNNIITIMSKILVDHIFISFIINTYVILFISIMSVFIKLLLLFHEYGLELLY